MMIYLLKSALLLALLYGGFALLLSRETFHRFNRLALLVVMIASLALPAMQLTMDKPSFFTISSLTPNPIEEGNSLTPNPSPRGEGSNMDEGSSLITENEQIIPFESDNKAESEKALPQRGSWEGALYLAGLFASFGFFLFQLFRFWRDTKGGTSTKDEEGNTIVIRGGDFSPYSFFHYIIISVSDYERLRKPILAHEQAHIRLGHSWDLLLLEVVKAIQWFNPFVYLLGRDLKAVHEYEADNAVLNQGIDAKTYQLLLVTKAVGNRLQTLGNNLSHHSLKKRIKMMHKTNSNRWMMTKAVVLPALMALAVVTFAKPKVEDNLQETQNSSEKLVKFKEGNPNRFAITIPKGTWRESTAYDKHDSYIEEETTQTPNFTTENVTIKLNGKVVDPNNLSDMPASALKKFEQKFPEKEINLITEPVQTPDSIKNDDKIYDKVDEIAQFPGGDEACFKWLKENMKYPKECVDKGIQGRVMIQFVVNKDGSIPEIKVLKSPHSLLSEEAVRVVKAMPKWKPAKDKGKVVRSRFNLPVMFKIPKTVVTGEGTPAEPVSNNDSIYTVVDELAQFPGGDEACMKWLADNIKYPEDCKKEGIGGRVHLSFVVEKDGSITNVKATRSPHASLSEEGERVVKAMPKWKPAKAKGEIVRQRFMLPILFRLPKESNQNNT